MLCKCRQTTLTSLQCCHVITHLFSLHNRLLECDAVSSDNHIRFVNTCCFHHHIRESVSLQMHRADNLKPRHFCLMPIIHWYMIWYAMIWYMIFYLLFIYLTACPVTGSNTTFLMSLTDMYTNATCLNCRLRASYIEDDRSANL
jgi:hypothetical protein